MSKKKPMPPQPAPAAPFNPAFAALAKLREGMGPAASQPAVEAPAPREEHEARPKLGAKVVLQREKKGHGGKTVTRISGLTANLEDLARTMKRSLGCGASVDGDTILLQGDQTARAAEWLVKNGAKQAIIGN